MAEMKKTGILFTGTKRAEMNLIDGLVGLLPSTHLTGAPRHKVLAYIDEHEDEHRRFHGGAFGTITSRDISFRSIQASTTFADGAVRRTVGTDLTAEMDPRSLCKNIHAILEG